jgi:type VI secretion system protein ImpK
MVAYVSGTGARAGALPWPLRARYNVRDAMGTSLDMGAMYPPPPPQVRREKLALLYQGILTTIVRIQSGRQPLKDAADFQKRMEGLFEQIQREAIKVGYRDIEIQDATYALVAFLDESIQRCDDPNRGAWTPLQSKMYAQSVAGEGVFDRLKTIRTRRDSSDLADVLEIYYLCFLLGYEGRYALAEHEKLEALMEDLRQQIEHLRGPQWPLSPEGAFPMQAAVAPPPPASPITPWMYGAIGCIALAIFGWIIFKLLLNSNATAIVSDIMAP